MKKMLLAFITLSFLIQHTNAQPTIELVKDINPNGDSHPRLEIEYNNNLYFIANDGIHGSELWFTNGTEEGTQMLKDIHTGSTHNSSIMYLVTFNGKMYFQGNDGFHHTEPWVTDGTEVGTKMLKDINPYPPINSSSAGGSFPIEFTVYNNNIYFKADDGDNGFELWITNGTEEGTVLFKDINPNGSSDPFEFTIYNDKLYFRASNGVHGQELWVTDGTDTGTVMVKDINTFPNVGSSPIGFTEFQDKLYFVAFDTTFNGNLWVTDGTETGTELVKNINLNNVGSLVQELTVYNNKLYFSADDGINGREVWRSDGTESGTVMLKNINANGSSNPHGFYEFEDLLYFSADDGINGNELWRSDGTEIGTVLFKDINPNGSSKPMKFVTYQEELYFIADDGSHGKELWKSDGTSDGTIKIVPEFYQNINDPLSSLVNFVIFKEALFFDAHYTEIGRELYKLTPSEVSISENKNAKNLNIYPNPTKDLLNLEVEKESQFSIFDITGKEVKLFNANSGKNTIDISNLSSGMYFIQEVNSGSQIKMIKL